MNPDYIGAYILDPGQEMNLTISKVALESYLGQPKIIAYFKENVKPMMLNNTNCTTIEMLAGTDLIENWGGTKITIYAAPVKFKKEMVEALRIRNNQPSPTKKEEWIVKRDTIAKKVNQDKQAWISALVDEGLITDIKQLNNKETVLEVYDRLRSVEDKVNKNKGV